MRALLNSEGLDRIGMAASLACGVHCALAPLAVGAMAVIPLEWAFSRASEAVMLGLTLLLAVASLAPAYLRQHRKKSCLGLFALGAGLLMVAKLALHGNPWEPTLLASGAGLIAAAHLANLHFCRQCKSCAHAEPQ